MNTTGTMKKLIYILTFWLLGTSAFAEWSVIEADTLPSPRDRMATVVMDGIAYFIGGNEQVGDITRATDDVLRYDLEAETWLDPAPPMLLPRIGATAAAYHGKIYVIGGRTEIAGGYIKNIEVWWPGRNFWVFADSLDPAREGAKAVVYNDSLYVLGGYLGADQYTSDVVKLIPDTTGTSIEVIPGLLPLAEPLTNHGVSVLNNTLYVYGGFYFGPQWKTRIFSPDSGWVEETRLSNPLGGMGYANVLLDNEEKILISGGMSTYEETESFLTLDTTGTWTEFPVSLPFPRAFHSMVSYPRDSSSTIVVAGGSWTQDGITRYQTNQFLIIQNDIDVRTDFKGSSVELPSTPSLHAWPNPFNGGVRVDLSGFGVTETVDLVLYNTLGQQVSSWSLTPRQIRGGFAWDGQLRNGAAPAGVYFLKASQHNKQAIVKLVRIP